MEEDSFRKTLEKIGQNSFFPGNSMRILKEGNLLHRRVGILDARVGKEMEEMFQQDLSDSRPVTLKEISSWPFHERAIGTIFFWFRSYL